VAYGRGVIKLSGMPDALARIAVPTSRKKIAIAIGVLADAAQAGMFAGMPALSWLPADALDIVVGITLVALLGFRWRFVLALAIELVPGAQLFPSWTAFVISLPTTAPQGQPGLPAHVVEARTV